VIHSLDIFPQFFEEIKLNIKLFEVRKDKPNRIFSIGDFLLLREVNESPFENIYTGRSLYVEVTYISSYVPNYKVLQIKKV
jgi:hypothetical protein